MRPMRPGRAARLLWAYGLGDTGTRHGRAQLGFYLFVFLPESPVCRPGWPGWCLMVDQKVWDGNQRSLRWLAQRHTKSRWGPRCPGLPEVPCRWGWRWPPTWWCARAASGRSSPTSCESPCFSRDCSLCVNLPIPPSPASSPSTPSLRTRLEHGALHRPRSCRTQGLVLGALLGPAADHRAPQHGARLRPLLIIREPWAALWGLSPVHGPLPSGATGDPEPNWTPVCDAIGANGRSTAGPWPSTCCSGAACS